MAKLYKNFRIDSNLLDRVTIAMKACDTTNFSQFLNTIITEWLDNRSLVSKSESATGLPKSVAVSAAVGQPAAAGCVMENCSATESVDGCIMELCTKSVPYKGIRMCCSLPISHDGECNLSREEAEPNVITTQPPAPLVVREVKKFNYSRDGKQLVPPVFERVKEPVFNSDRAERVPSGAGIDD